MKTFNFGFLDEDAKKEIRRSILKAIAIPGYLVAFASREMPVSRGWGTGGLQITLSIILEKDTLKVIDQGTDHSVNAVILRKFIQSCTNCKTTLHTDEATIIQTRHRIPEIPTNSDQILVFQVPIPDVLTIVEPSPSQRRILHAYNDYSKLWVLLYEDVATTGESRFSHRYPVVVNNRYVMDPSPIPRYDIPKLNLNPSLLLFGAGREKMIYAIPPYTPVKPLTFEDIPFKVENFPGQRCEKCGASNVFLDLVYINGEKHYFCNDPDFCQRNQQCSLK